MSRLRRQLISLVLCCFSSLGYAANYQCSVIPQDNVDIKPQTVEVYGSSGSLMIKPDGSVSRNNQSLTLSDETRNKAKTYQDALRTELPYIYQTVNKQADQFYTVLDNTLSKKLGNNSQARTHLKGMRQQLTEQLHRVLRPTQDGMIFDAQAIKTVEKEGQALLRKQLGAIAQAALNDMGNQGLQGILGGFDSLQKELKKVWQTQMQQSTVVANDICGRVRALEDQRLALIRVLPK